MAWYLSSAPPPSTGALTRFLAVQYLRYHRYPYVDAVPQGTCSPAGSRIPYEIYAPRLQYRRSLDTPTVRCPVVRCLPCAQKLGCLRLGRSHRRISTPLTYISLLPPPHLCLWLWCQCSVGVADSRFPMIPRVSGFQVSMK